MNAPRHLWSEPNRTEHETRRTCDRCGLAKVTRHEPGALPWNEYWRDASRVHGEGDRTPACELVEVAS